jgi:hypothetical protein
MFDLANHEGCGLHYLHLAIIQSPHGIPIDQSHHINTHILDFLFCKYKTCLYSSQAVPISFGSFL